jgi:hypothetical protein
MTLSLRKKLTLASIGAGALLVTAVLPAEYGIDPTGVGKLTGLSALSGLVAPASAGTDFGQELSFNVEDYDLEAEELNQDIRGMLDLQDTPFVHEVIVLEIEDLGEMEHKFIMKQDETLMYSWKLLEGKGDGVFYEFHGHPSSADAVNYPEGFEMAYSKGEGMGQNGSLTAAYPGYHGWYFMNLEEGPIKIELTVSGFYSEHKEMYRAVDGQVIHTVDF